MKGRKNGDHHIRGILMPIPGIKSVLSNPVTGSVTILYDDRKSSPHAITDHLELAGYFDKSRAVTNDQCIHAVASSALSILSRLLL